jgi:hypothetical protein
MILNLASAPFGHGIFVPWVCVFGERGWPIVWCLAQGLKGREPHLEDNLRKVRADTSSRACWERVCVAASAIPANSAPPPPHTHTMICSVSYVLKWATSCPVAGKIIWTREVQSYTGTPGYSRTSPAVEGDYVVIGTNHGGIVKYSRVPDSTYVLALSKNNGNLIWKTLVDPHPLAGIVTSPTIANGAGASALNPLQI